MSVPLGGAVVALRVPLRVTLCVPLGCAVVALRVPLGGALEVYGSR